MTKNFRVPNLSRPGYSRKHSWVERAVADCRAIWVEYGVSYRDLTVAESLAARNEQARLRDPLPHAELIDIHFEPPAYASAKFYESLCLAWEANKLVQA